MYACARICAECCMYPQLFRPLQRAWVMKLLPAALAAGLFFLMKRKASGLGVPGLTSRAAVKVAQTFREDPNVANEIAAHWHQGVSRAI